MGNLPEFVVGGIIGGLTVMCVLILLFLFIRPYLAELFKEALDELRAMRDEQSAVMWRIWRQTKTVVIWSDDDGRLHIEDRETSDLVDRWFQDPDGIVWGVYDDIRLAHMIFPKDYQPVSFLDQVENIEVPGYYDPKDDDEEIPWSRVFM